MNEIPIVARKIKISVPVRAQGLPGVPLEGPIGDLTLRLALEGSSLAIPARINGKSYRRMLRTVAEKGPENVAITLQGELVARPGGGPVTLDAAGFQVIVKTSPPPARVNPFVKLGPVADAGLGATGSSANPCADATCRAHGFADEPVAPDLGNDPA